MGKRRSRVMLIGAIGAGKSTLTNALLGNQVEAIKTQTLTYYDWIVDTPGEYTENPLYYKSIMATALEVTHVIFLQDATNSKSIFPPSFATGIPKLPLGVVTKADAQAANVKRAVQQLSQVILTGPIIITSALTKQGVTEIRDLVQCTTLEQMRMYCVENNIYFKWSNIN